MKLAPKTQEFLDSWRKCLAYDDENEDFTSHNFIYSFSAETLNGFNKELFEVGLCNKDIDMVEDMKCISTLASYSDASAYEDMSNRETLMGFKEFLRFNVDEVNWIDKNFPAEHGKLVHDVFFMQKAIEKGKYDFFMGVEKHFDSIDEDDYGHVRRLCSFAIFSKLSRTDSTEDIKRLGDCLTEIYRGCQEGSETLEPHSLVDCRKILLSDNSSKFAFRNNGVFGKEGNEESPLNQASLRMISKRFFGTPGLHGDEKAISGLVNMIDTSLELLREDTGSEKIESPLYEDVIASCLSEITKIAKIDGEKYNKYFVQALDKIDEEIYVNATNIKSIDFLANLVGDPSITSTRFFEMLEMNPDRVEGVISSIAEHKDLSDLKYKKVMAHFVDHWKDDVKILELVAKNRFMQGDSKSDIAAFTIGRLEDLGVSFDFTANVLPEIGAKTGFSSNTDFGGVKISRFNRELFDWSLNKGAGVNELIFENNSVNTTYSKILSLTDKTSAEYVERVADIDWSKQLLVAVADGNEKFAAKCLSNGAVFDHDEFENSWQLQKVYDDSRRRSDYYEHRNWNYESVLKNAQKEMVVQEKDKLEDSLGASKKTEAPSVPKKKLKL